jgi:hypothetical protein
MLNTNIPLSQAAEEILKKLMSLNPDQWKEQIPFSRAGDELWSYLSFKQRHGRAPTNKMLFNDVLYRIKTSDEILDPLRVFVSDKELVKLYVKALLGGKYTIPTLAVIKNPQTIDTTRFPKSCCIKPTHLSGSVILRQNGEVLDRSLIKSWFTMNYYERKREANYQRLAPKVIIEPLIFNSHYVTDYKFFCYQGKVKLIQVDRDRQTDLHRLIYSADWQVQDFTIRYPKAKTEIPKPDNLSEMISVAETLAENFNFIRVDLYSDGQSCLVGELTNLPGNASMPFIPKEAHERASQMIFGV